MEQHHDLNMAISAIKVAQSVLRKDLLEVNVRVSEIEAEIIQINSLPVSLSDYSSYLKSRIDETAKKHLSRLESELFGSTIIPGQPPANATSFGRLEGALPLLPSGFLGSGGSVSVEAACLFFGEQVYESFLKHSQTKFGKRWGNESYPTAAERRETIAGLLTKKALLEKDREGLTTKLDELARTLAG